MGKGLCGEGYSTALKGSRVLQGCSRGARSMQRATRGVLRGSRGTQGLKGHIRSHRITSLVLWRQRFVWLKGHSTGKIVVHALPNVPPLPPLATPHTTLRHRTTRCNTAHHVATPHATLQRRPPMRYLTCGITSHRIARVRVCMRACARFHVHECGRVRACTLARTQAAARVRTAQLSQACCAALRCIGSALA
jgi:hypothetical protein